MKRSRLSRWWGEIEIPVERAARLRVGALTIMILRHEKEWRIAVERAEDPLTPGCEIDVSLPPDASMPGTEAIRLATRRTDDRLVVVPALADRPVVTRPEIPLQLLAGDEATLFVTTPLFVRLQTGSPPRDLMDLPVFRPSDTWFGPSPMEGELAYAGRTHARLDLEGLTLRVSRAITTVTLRNRGQDRLMLERISLPVPNLRLFADERNVLWTTTVTVERYEGIEAKVLLAKGPPENVVNAELVAGPRIETQQNVFKRALHALLG